MGRIPKSHVWLALALLPFLTTGELVAQPKPPPVEDPPKEKLPGILGYKPMKADPKDDELKKLQIARYNEALEQLKDLNQFVLVGTKTPDIMFDAGKRLCLSGLEVYDDPKDRIRLLTDYVELMKNVEKTFQAQLEGGRIDSSVVHEARYFRIDGEIQLLKIKRAAEKPKEK